MHKLKDIPARKTFIRFLMQSNAYKHYQQARREYLDYCRRDARTIIYRNLSFAWTPYERNGDNVIDHSLMWNRTQDGVDYWMPLDREWREYHHQHQEQIL